jgi:hypothetical protein
MSAFPKTRAAAEYAARHSRAELTRAAAVILLARLGVCEDFLPGGDGDVPAALHGPLRDLVLAVRDVAGPAWLDASGDDPDVAAFTVLQATASPPDPARIDEICSRVLWARFAQAQNGMTPATPAPDPAAQLAGPPAPRTGERRPAAPGPGNGNDGPGSTSRYPVGRGGQVSRVADSWRRDQLTFPYACEHPADKGVAESACQRAGQLGGPIGAPRQHASQPGARRIDWRRTRRRSSVLRRPVPRARRRGRGPGEVRAVAPGGLTWPGP